MFGLAKVDNGSPSSRRVLVSSSPRPSSSAAQLPGQIPTGWYAGRYGIPDDIIAQTDRTTLWALVSTMEALNASGITDPYELYKHMHPLGGRHCFG